MKVYALNIDHLTANIDLEELMKIMPEAARDEINAYSREADRNRVLGGKLLLLYAMQHEKTSFDLSMVEASPKGKLFIRETGFEFNISHSGKYVVLATTWDDSCGIDVEMQRQVDIDMFRRLFTDGEWEAITGADDPQKLFFKCWAIKESVIKADGRGVEVISKTEIWSNDHAECDGETWYFQILNIAEGYSSALARKSPFATQIEINRVNSTDLSALLSPR